MTRWGSGLGVWTGQVYLRGGLCWFAVPFTMATSMGLAARAMVSVRVLGLCVSNE
jgi:hypothetical protein